MAIVTRTYNINYIAQDSLSRSRRLALPLRLDLPELPPPFLANVSESYNCNLCGESPYFLPYVHGDVLPFQFRFVDPYHNDPQDLFVGWKTSTSAAWYIEIKIFDGTNDALLFDDADAVSSSYYVGFRNDLGSIQTIFIDTANFPLDLNCFYIEVSLYEDGGGGVPAITQTFISEKFTLVKCEDTVLFSSTYSKFDCLGRYYGNLTNTLGTTFAPFMDSLRMQGFVEFLGKFKTKVFTDENVEVSVESVERFTFITPAIAPFAACLLDAVTNGKDVSVNGVRRYNFGDIDKNNADTKAFFVDLTFESDTCKIERFNCD